MRQQVSFTHDEIAALTGGAWVSAPPDDAPPIRAVLDDSRLVQPGALFVAIAGEFADGHDFVEKAVSSGAAAVCLEHFPSEEVEAAVRNAGTPCLLADDSLRAFQLLAQAHRRRFPDMRMIGITGSSGKTSTKEMIAAVLEQHWPEQVLKTEGNTNNHFGVPRNLLRLSSNHRAAVIEIGTNHPGEIAALTALVEPDIGVVSNIGPAHLEFFGDTDGVAREKAALLELLPAAGTAVYHAEAPGVDILRQRAGSRRAVTFGEGPGCDVRMQYEGARGDLYGVTLEWTDTGTPRTFDWAWGGRHQALNAGAAAAVGKALGMAPEAVVQGLKACRLPKMRMEIREHEGVHWINDAYNANPASMRAGMSWFLEKTEGLPPDARVLVLGDMLEMGPSAEAEHEALLHWVCEQLTGARLLTVGPIMGAVAPRCGVPNVADAATARATLAEFVEPGKWVFVKASRGIKLETVLPAPLQP